MRRVTWLVLAIALLGAAAATALRTPQVPHRVFDPTRLAGGIDAYFAAAEAPFDDITPGVQKRVIWAASPETRTPWAVVYLHGFSATSEEVRPLPDLVAQALGANLVYTRLAGHGRGSAPMAEATLGAWMDDVSEALAVARAVGERVLVMGTSTGATLATLALGDAAERVSVAGVVMVSPNYRPRNPLSAILTWPGVRWWGPLLAGQERNFEPHSDAQAQYWTTRYPTVATLPMGAAVLAARRADHAALVLPALFVFSDADQVVDARTTRQVAAAWGGPVKLHPVQMGPRDDPSSHVIAGDIMSPDQTEGVARAVLDWVAGL